MKPMGDISKEFSALLAKTREVMKMHALTGFLVTLVLLILVVVIFYGGESLFEGQEKTRYKVTWLEQTSPEVSYSHEIKENDILIIENAILQNNLTFIQFELCWEDNRDGLVRNLSDKLTMEIVPPADAQVKFQPSRVLEGYESPLLIIAAVNNIPRNLAFTHLDIQEIMQQVDDYSTSNGIGNWKINLSVDAKALFDRGNNIRLIISYDYYESLIEEES